MTVTTLVAKKIDAIIYLCTEQSQKQRVIKWIFPCYCAKYPQEYIFCIFGVYLHPTELDLKGQRCTF